ncbi:MAG: LptF/LptG family permease [Bacteroidales bacterium]|nr:YjgP/YjgQ family permease [Bacteroidales bacterium]MBR1950585.1 LptF/LptG family permease [Bacteroidales bacterium]MBR4087769.1 LptF/LptG family permease [Bacteroidales bacterium]
MKKLDLFILKSFLGPFIMTFLIVLFVLMMQFLWLYIDELVGKGLSLGVIFEFLGWGSATLFPLALPLATLLASIMTMGSFGENNELLAMKAAGIPLLRILSPLMILSVLISVAAFFASNNLIPVAYENIYTLRDDIGKTKEEIKIPTGIFYNGIDGYTLRVVERDENDVMHNVMVYDHSKGQGNISLTVADSGIIKMSSDKSSLTFTLYNGTNYEETNTRTKRDSTYSLQKVNFTMQEIVIPLSNYAFQKSESSKYGNEVMTKGLAQLRIDRDSLEVRHEKSLDNLVRRASHPDNLNHTVQIIKLKTEPGVMKGSMNIDSLLCWKGAEEEQEAYSKAISQLDMQIANVQYFPTELNQIAYPLRRTIQESFRKFTLSIACIIFFFIGAPLGAIIRKGGLGTPVIVSMFFFVIYWVVDISGKKLANDGAISPFLGAFISTFVLFPMGVFLTWKSTKDSALFNADAYIMFFKNLFSKTKLHKKQQYE